MFAILTSRPGQYRTELGEGLLACESYDYLFCGQAKARFVIANLLRDARIRVIDDAVPERVNDIPCKCLPKFATIEAARAQLQCLTRSGGVATALRRLP